MKRNKHAVEQGI